MTFCNSVIMTNTCSLDLFEWWGNSRVASECSRCTKLQMSRAAPKKYIQVKSLFLVICWKYFCVSWKVSGKRFLFQVVLFILFLNSILKALSRGGCKVVLVSFVWFFSTVSFQMSPQGFSMTRCIITLVAFVSLFSTVYFHMRPQIACLRRGKVTLITFVWLFSTVCHCVFSSVSSGH